MEAYVTYEGTKNKINATEQCGGRCRWEFTCGKPTFEELCALEERLQRTTGLDSVVITNIIPLAD